MLSLHLQTFAVLGNQNAYPIIYIYFVAVISRPSGVTVAASQLLLASLWRPIGICIRMAVHAAGLNELAERSLLSVDFRVALTEFHLGRRVVGDSPFLFRSRFRLDIAAPLRQECPDITLSLRKSATCLSVFVFATKSSMACGSFCLPLHSFFLCSPIISKLFCVVVETPPQAVQ